MGPAVLLSRKRRLPMLNLLIYSHYFAPSVGGVESIVESLARGLTGYQESNG
jgi:hypothetical protein